MFVKTAGHYLAQQGIIAGLDKLWLGGTVNVEIFDARKFRALWTGPIIFNFRAH